jgi:HPt (histidine-containing phosphotransfer) domain-containing protein
MVATHGDSAAKFREAIAAEDFERLVFLAHGLKGTAGNLAANAIHALAGQVVTAARQGDHQAFRLADTLIIKLERMLDQLSRYIAGTTPA